MPKLSVLLPAYNGIDNYPGHQMEKSIQSILDLDIDLELIVINDGSTDATFDHLMKLWECVSNMRVISIMSNQGQAAALNKGLEVATGDYIWQWSVRAQATPEAAQMVAVLDSDPTIGFVYGQMRSYSGKKEYIHRPPRVFDRQRFMNRYLCNFYMYRRLPGLQYHEPLTLDDGRTIGICDRDMAMQLMDNGMVGYGLHDTPCVDYYNGDRHTMHDVIEHREQIDEAFNERWERVL